MANPRNERMVETLRAMLADAKTFFLVDYQGLSAGEFNTLRADVREAGGRIFVAKNTLVRVVLEEQGFDGFGDTLTGPTALVLIEEDPVAPAKALTEFAKKHPSDLPTPKGGLLQGDMIGADTIERVSKLPSRDQVLSEVVGVLQAPLQQLVGVLEAPQRDLVSVMSNYKQELEEES